MKILLLGLFFCLTLAGAAHSAAKQNLMQAGSDAERQGYFNLAAHYYFQALKASPKDAQLQAAFDRVMQKRREARASAASKLSKIEPGPKSEVPIARGHAAFVGGETRSTAKGLNEYNLAAPRSNRVKYVFVNAGSLIIDGPKLSLEWNPDSALIYGDTLLGEGRTYPIISGSSTGAAAVPAAEWERAAKELCDKLNADDRLHGILIELQPQEASLAHFYAAIRKITAKPSGVALPAWDKTVFRYADFIVLRTIDSAVAARDQIKAFLDDARAESGKAIVALKSADSAAFENGRAALGLSVDDDDLAYLGIAADFPADEKTLELLKLPLERP